MISALQASDARTRQRPTGCEQCLHLPTLSRKLVEVKVGSATTSVPSVTELESVAVLRCDSMYK
jgi:hypothetical protein